MLPGCVVYSHYLPQEPAQLPTGLSTEGQSKGGSQGESREAWEEIGAEGGPGGSEPVQEEFTTQPTSRCAAAGPGLTLSTLSTTSNPNFSHTMDEHMPKAAMGTGVTCLAGRKGDTGRRGHSGWAASHLLCHRDVPMGPDMWCCRNRSSVVYARKGGASLVSVCAVLVTGSPTLRKGCCWRPRGGQVL